MAAVAAGGDFNRADRARKPVQYSPDLWFQAGGRSLRLKTKPAVTAMFACIDLRGKKRNCNNCEIFSQLYSPRLSREEFLFLERGKNME